MCLCISNAGFKGQCHHVWLHLCIWMYMNVYVSGQSKCRCTWRQEKRITSTRTRETGDRESLDTGGGTWTQILWKINHKDSNHWMSNLSAIILLILRLISNCYLLYGVLHHTIFQFFEHSFFLPLCFLNSGFLCQQRLTSLHFRKFLM